MNRRLDAFPYLLLVPAALLTLAIVAWPLVETVRLSFTDASVRATENYVGWRNYERIFTGGFVDTIWRTVLWASLSVSLKLAFGLFGAVLLNAAVPGRAVFRVLTMPPWIVPIAIGVFMWSWMYNGQFGMISGLLQSWGFVSEPVEFLGGRTSAFLATVVTDVWIGTPLVTLYLLAAMQTVSPELHEAAWVDGASRFYRFRRVTLPLIAPSIATMGLLSAIWTFNSFEIIWILTKGGPGSTTTTMIVDAYKVGISRFQYGAGAARAVTILLFLIVFSGIYALLLSRLAKRARRMEEAR